MTKSREHMIFLLGDGAITVELEPSQQGQFEAVELLECRPSRQRLQEICTTIASQFGPPELGISLWEGKRRFAILVRSGNPSPASAVIATCKPSSYAAAMMLQLLGIHY